jgi:hypothetical protein
VTVDICGNTRVAGQLAENVARANEAADDGLDRSVTGRVGVEIDGPVLRKIDLAAPSVGTQKFSGMIAPGDRDRVEAERRDLCDYIWDTLVGEVPGIGVHRSVSHEGPVCYLVRSPVPCTGLYCRACEPSLVPLLTLIALQPPATEIRLIVKGDDMSVEPRGDSPLMPAIHL